MRLAVVGTDLAPLDQDSGALERVVLAWAEAVEDSGQGLEVVRVDGRGTRAELLSRLDRLDLGLVVLNNRPLWAEEITLPAIHVLHNYPDAWGSGSEDHERVRAALERGIVGAVSPSLARDITLSYRLSRPVREIRVEVDPTYLDAEWQGNGGPVLFPNRLLEKKGVRLFVAIAHKRPELTHVMFRHLAPWTAPTPEHEQLLSLIRAAGSVGLLDPPRSRQEMASWYARASVVLCPSVQPEGLGMVALEAQAVGTPLVTSGLGGLTDATLPPNETVPQLEADPWCQAIDRAKERPPSALTRQTVAGRYGRAAAGRSFLALVREAAGL
ncbi:MAG: glycosyltransferase [Acidimicrobiales bacterium]